MDGLGFKKIANVASSKEAWHTLEVAYRGNDRVRQIRLQVLIREFEGLTGNRVHNSGREGGQPTRQEWRANASKPSGGEYLEVIDK